MDQVLACLREVRSGKHLASVGVECIKSMNLGTRSSCNGLKDFGELGGVPSCSNIHPECLSEHRSQWEFVNFGDDDEMCRIDDNDYIVISASKKFKHHIHSSICNQLIRRVVASSC